MDTKYTIKTKVDGRYLTLGNVQPGERGPRMGLRITPELRQMVASAEDGKWLNFLLFPDDGQRPQQTSKPSQSHDTSLDEIPF